MKTLFYGDLHYGHENVIAYDGRPWATVEEMNSALVERWNAAVGKNDTVWFLGDLAMHVNAEGIRRLVGRLAGRKLLVKGNHDSRPDTFYRDCGFARVYDRPVLLMERFILSHRPVDTTDSRFFNIHAHVHNHPDYPDASPWSRCVSACRTDYRPVEVEEFNETLAVWRGPGSAIPLRRSATNGAVLP